MGVVVFIIKQPPSPPLLLPEIYLTRQSCNTFADEFMLYVAETFGIKYTTKM